MDFPKSFQYLIKRRQVKCWAKILERDSKGNLHNSAFTHTACFFISWIEDRKLKWALKLLPMWPVLPHFPHFSLLLPTSLLFSQTELFCLPQRSSPPLPHFFSGLSPPWEWPFPSALWSHAIALYMFPIFFPLQNIQ